MSHSRIIRCFWIRISDQEPRSSGTGLLIQEPKLQPKNAAKCRRIKGEHFWNQFYYENYRNQTSIDNECISGLQCHLIWSDDALLVHWMRAKMTGHTSIVTVTISVRISPFKWPMHWQCRTPYWPRDFASPKTSLWPLLIRSGKTTLIAIARLTYWH